MQQQPEQFEQWALVEMMGRQRIAGLVTERVIAGAGFLQVDVPETKDSPKFTRFISPSALYAINPLDEVTARIYAEGIKAKPIEQWDISAFMRKAEEQRALNAAKREEEELAEAGPMQSEYQDEDDIEDED